MAQHKHTWLILLCCACLSLTQAAAADEEFGEQPQEEPQAEQPQEQPQEEPQAEQPQEEPQVEQPQAEQPQEEPQAEQPQEEPQVEQPQEQPQEEPQAEQPQEQPQEEPQAEQPQEQPQEEPQAEQPQEQPQGEPQVEQPQAQGSEEVESEDFAANKDKPVPDAACDKAPHSLKFLRKPQTISVTGSTPAQISASSANYRKQHGGEGAHTVPIIPDTFCTTKKSVDLTIEIKIQYLEWTSGKSSASAQDIKTIEKYIKAIKDHEYQHVANIESAYANVHDKIRDTQTSAPLDDANTAAEKKHQALDGSAGCIRFNSTFDDVEIFGDKDPRCK